MNAGTGEMLPAGREIETSWETAEAVARAWRTQAAEMSGPMRITAGNATAYRTGDVAFVSDRPTFHLADGKTLPFRFTVAWLHEPEGWRIIQAMPHSVFRTRPPFERRSSFRRSQSGRSLRPPKESAQQNKGRTGKSALW